jgi:hypothetical protein
LETHFAAAYWGPRKEPVKACAWRARTFLTVISEVSELFQRWRAQGRSLAEAARATPIDLSTDALAELFMKGRNRLDVGGDVIEDLGFRISVWNGRANDQEAASLSIKCGLYSTVGLSNAVVLNLPKQFDTQSQDLSCALIRALVPAWEPDWAIVSSQSARSLRSGHSPFLDKALYLASKVPPPVDLKEPVVKQAQGNGFIFLRPSSAG